MLDSLLLGQLVFELSQPGLSACLFLLNGDLYGRGHLSGVLSVEKDSEPFKVSLGLLALLDLLLLKVSNSKTQTRTRVRSTTLLLYLMVISLLVPEPLLFVPEFIVGLDVIGSLILQPVRWLLATGNNKVTTLPEFQPHLASVLDISAFVRFND